MSVYKLYGAGSGGVENALAQIDIQFDGEIEALALDAFADMDADGEFFSCEVSFLSTNTITVNDARGSLLSGRTQMHISTSGISNGQVNHSVGGLSIPVSAGERVFLHLSASAGLASQANAYVYVRDRVRPGLRRRR